MRSLLGLLLLVAVACGCNQQPAPIPPPLPDASDASPPPAPTPAPPAPQTPCGDACQALAAIACPEASWSDCAAVLTHIEADALVHPKAGGAFSCAAIANAKTVAQAQALGIVCKKP